MLALLVLAGCAMQQSTESTAVEQNTNLPPGIQKYNEKMSAKEIPQDAGVRQTTLAIKDMTCPSCALGVEYELKQLDGVYDAKINYPAGTGQVIYDTSKLSAEEIAAASTIYPATVASDEAYAK